MCPTSNLNTSIFENYEAYPLRKFMDAGVKVTVNTDNMMVSYTTVAEEIQHLNLTKTEQKLIAENAAEAAFADAETKKWMLEEIEKRFV
jgi:adenosine deaminase